MQGPSRASASRRTVFGLAGAATAAATTGAVAGCTSDDGATDDSEGTAQDGAGDFSVAASEIPVEGGTVFDDPEVVVTQPEEGTFVGFSAECPHQGCSVTDVSDGKINCVCHGSAFDLTDGSVLEGPAEDPLPQVELDVTDDTISLA